jgi:hypothetical protein
VEVLAAAYGEEGSARRHASIRSIARAIGRYISA